MKCGWKRIGKGSSQTMSLAFLKSTISYYYVTWFILEKKINKLFSIVNLNHKKILRI